MITDTAATKPDDWLENEPETIPDPEAEKPEEWDVSASPNSTGFVLTGCRLYRTRKMETGSLRLYQTQSARRLRDAELGRSRRSGIRTTR